MAIRAVVALTIAPMPAPVLAWAARRSFSSWRLRRPGAAVRCPAAAVRYPRQFAVLQARLPRLPAGP